MKNSILAIMFAVIFTAACSTPSSSKEEKTTEDSTKKVEAVDTTAKSVDTPVTTIK